MPEGKGRRKSGDENGDEIKKNGDLESIINNSLGLVFPLGTGRPIASWQLVLWG